MGCNVTVGVTTLSNGLESIEKQNMELVLEVRCADSLKQREDA